MRFESLSGSKKKRNKRETHLRAQPIKSTNNRNSSSTTDNFGLEIDIGGTAIGRAESNFERFERETTLRKWLVQRMACVASKDDVNR